MPILMYVREKHVFRKMEKVIRQIRTKQTPNPPRNIIISITANNKLLLVYTITVKCQCGYIYDTAHSPFLNNMVYTAYF